MLLVKENICLVGKQKKILRNLEILSCTGVVWIQTVVTPKLIGHLSWTPSVTTQHP